MLKLTKDDIYLDQHADNKQQAIKNIAKALIDNQFVENGYDDGMLEREWQAVTYLGNGIAIPHGTTTTRHLVKKTGVQVFCFPKGVIWGEDGEKAYIAIGIAASSNEHLTLLRQLTRVLCDDDIEEKIEKIKTIDDAICLLTGQKKEDISLLINENLIRLDVKDADLQTMQALNASKLKTINAVDNAFISDVLNKKPSYLGAGIWLNDNATGNQKNAISICRLDAPFSLDDKVVHSLLTVSCIDDSNSAINKLIELKKNQKLALINSLDKTSLITLFYNENTIEPTNISQSISQEFTILNSHGLHTRPASTLVKLAKQFNSKITISNLDGTKTAVSATSLMKIVALGAKKGCRIEVTATGNDAHDAIKAFEEAVQNCFGEETE